MEEKHNNATPQRPDGARTLDAALVPVDLPKYIQQLQTEEAYHKNGKNAITVFKTAKVTITLIALKNGEIIKPGSEEQEAIMSLQVIEGTLSFENHGTILEVKTGQLITLHQTLSFSARAFTDCICLLTMLK